MDFISSCEAQEVLLEEELSEMTIDTAFKKVVAMDRRKADALELQSHSIPPVNRVRVQSGSRKNDGNGCTKCGLMNHSAEECRTVCFGCGEKYHIRRNCKDSKKKARRRKVKRDNQHHVSEESSDDQFNYYDTVGCVSDSMYYVEVSENVQFSHDQSRGKRVRWLSCFLFLMIFFVSGLSSHQL